MGLFDLAKAVGAKIFGATKTPAAPPEEVRKEAKEEGLELSKVEAKAGGEDAVPPGAAVSTEEIVTPPGSAASTEEADRIGPASEQPAAITPVQNDLAAGKVPETKFYTVQHGDTLWKIAEAEYGPGQGSKYHLIFEANKPLLSDPDKIEPGQVLRIPPLEE